MTETYRFRIKGHLVAHCADWFDGMTITRLDNGEALIEGLVVDQAALHGMLNHIRDLGLPLLAVERLEPGDESAVNTEPSADHDTGGDSRPFGRRD